jgi:hypothetical protein
LVVQEDDDRSLRKDAVRMWSCRRFATAFMNNPGQASGSTLIDPATNWLHREEGLDFFTTMASF